MSRSKEKARPGRMTATFLCCLLAIPTLCRLLPPEMMAAEQAGDALAVGVILGLAYLVLRPLLRLVTLPIGCLTLGLFNLVLDAGLIYACAWFIPGFTVGGPVAVLIAAVFVNTLSAVAGGFR